MEDSTLQGFAQLLKAMRGDKGEVAQADAIDPVVTSSDTTKGYDNGGVATPAEDDPEDAGTNTDESGTPIEGPMADGASPHSGVPQDTDYLDKLAAVMQAMGLGAKSALNTVTGGVASLANNTASAATPAITNGLAHAAPYAVQAANTMGGLNLPVPAAPVSAPAAPLTQVSPSVTPPTQSVAPAPVIAKPASAPVKPDSSAPAAPSSAPVANMLNTMTGGDSEKLQQVLSQLKDQQTRGQFAKALATIGDTFANVGMARAGKEPQGYKGTEIVDKNNKDTQANLVENIKTQLANDPNSQTSKFAQQAAANILGIKPGDPRMAGLARAPAAVLSSQLPPLGDSVKTQLDREAQTIQQKQFEESKHIQARQILEQQKDRMAQLAISQMGANTAAEKAKTEAASGAVEHLSPLNPLNWGTINAAKNAISSAVGGGHPAPAHPQDAAAVNWAHMHPNDPRAHKILSVNGL